jgi:hypothetical protein
VTINSYFYDSVDGDRPYTAGDFAKAFGVIVKTGIIQKDDAGALGFDIGGTAYTTVYEGKAVVEGRFVEVTGTETLTVPTGSYSGMVVIRVDMTDERKATLEVKTTQTAQQDAAIYELPLYNVTVSNGAITAVTDKRVQGGAVAKMAANVVTWTDDPNGVWLNVGSHNGKAYKMFLTSAQPGAGGSGERRVWIQTDA